MQQEKRRKREPDSKVKILNNARGLGFRLDARTVVDRMTQRLHPGWVKEASARGVTPLTFSQARAIVAAYAEEWERKQRVLKESNKRLKTKIECNSCGFTATSMSDLVRHKQEKHKNKD